MCSGRIQGRGHVQGREVVEVTGHAVAVGAGRGDDITVVAVVATDVVAAIPSTAVAVAASHQDAVEVPRNTTTPVRQMNSGGVVANHQQRMRMMPARLETTNHRREINVSEVREPMNRREMVKMTMLMILTEAPRLLNRPEHPRNKPSGFYCVNRLKTTPNDPVLVCVSLIMKCFITIKFF